jgi:dihydroflavonol-4-reductase
MSLHLVTGASGHIGNVLVRQLLENGQAVRALVRPGRQPAALAGLEVEQVVGDILDYQSLVDAMQGVEVVHHMAARISLAAEEDAEAERVNLDGTCNVLRAMKATAVRRLVYASSIYALKIPESGVVDESLPFDPQHACGPYDRSKAKASLEVQKAAAEGVDAVIVCPTAVTGPFDYQRSETGRGILYNISPGIKFTIDGAYDFVDVRDTAQGILRAVEHGKAGEVYILGGERLTVAEVAACIWEAAGGWHQGIKLPGWVADLAADLLPLISDDPLVTPYSLAAVRSNSHISHVKASSQLGYRPRPAREALREAVRWWLDQMGETEKPGEMVTQPAG